MSRYFNQLFNPYIFPSTARRQSPIGYVTKDTHIVSRSNYRNTETNAFKMLKYEAFIRIHLLGLSSPPLQHNFHHVFTSQASKPIPAIIPCFEGNTISSWQNTWLCHHPRQLRPVLPGHRPPEPHAADAAGDRPLRSLPPARRLRRPRPPPSVPPILLLLTNTQDYVSYAAASFGVLAG